MSRRDVDADAEFKWLSEFYDENVDSIINRDVVLGFDSMFLRLKEFDDLDKRKTDLNTEKQRLLQDEIKLVQKLKELEEKTEKKKLQKLKEDTRRISVELEEKTEKKVKSEKSVKKKEIAMVIQKLKEDIRRISDELEEIDRVDEKEIKAELKNIKDTVINCTTEIVNEMIEAGALVAGFLKHEEDDKDDEEDEDDDDVFEPVTIRELVISSFIVSVKLINDNTPYLVKLFKSGTKIHSKKIISLIFAILERTDYQGCKVTFGITRRSPFLSRRKVPKSLQRSAQKRQKKKSKSKSKKRSPKSRRRCLA